MQCGGMESPSNGRDPLNPFVLYVIRRFQRCALSDAYRGRPCAFNAIYLVFIGPVEPAQYAARAPQVAFDGASRLGRPALPGRAEAVQNNEIDVSSTTAAGGGA